MLAGGSNVVIADDGPQWFRLRSLTTPATGSRTNERESARLSTSSASVRSSTGLSSL